MIHDEPHPLAGQTVMVNMSGLADPRHEFRIEDWYDRVTGGSWMFAEGNPAAIGYAVRGLDLPTDNEVVYGKIGALGYIVHVSEIEVPF